MPKSTVFVNKNK